MTFEKCLFPSCSDKATWIKKYDAVSLGMMEVPLCDEHKRINEECYAIAFSIQNGESESKLDIQHKEYHNQLFGDPQKRKDVVQCSMCGFFSLPYEPIFYLDTREGIEWAEWAYREHLREERPWELDTNSQTDPIEVEKQDTRVIADIVSKIKADREAAERENELEYTQKSESERQESIGQFDYECYIPDCKFRTHVKRAYERHVVTQHYGKGLCYPGKVDLELYGWKAQGRKWEI